MTYSEQKFSNASLWGIDKDKTYLLWSNGMTTKTLNKRDLALWMIGKMDQFRNKHIPHDHEINLIEIMLGEFEHDTRSQLVIVLDKE